MGSLARARSGNQVIDSGIRIQRVQSLAIKLDIVSGDKLARTLAGANSNLLPIHKERKIFDIDCWVKSGCRHLLLRHSIPAVALDQNLQSALSGDGPLIIDWRAR